MSLDTIGPLNVLKSMVTSLAGMQQPYNAIPEGIAGAAPVFVGIPSSRDQRVSATLTLAGMPLADKASGLMRRTGRYWLVFACRLDDDETGAETTIATLVDQFTTAWLGNRRLKDGTGNPTCLSSDLDFKMADRPDYQMDAAREQRVYPLVVSVVQDASYDPTQ